MYLVYKKVPNKCNTCSSLGWACVKIPVGAEESLLGWIWPKYIVRAYEIPEE